ncbi:Protein kinase-like (PK-like) [Glarea lozoyensis ATCC 20868]|uniref:Protein kinase-like (PK-like) n=1 Tax=Glarea lozoyensis (strain ATCC 20868 / MF5171) TaxID=1116229 RepID=S3CRU4_GLAL2|nr:Protein kinase-like (PK-like) [Glarea lozoyensis ATCC 20868]EPE28390.1 Protein kinase-like (PK-like) [Glarea lozoyensis ATCC 20868]
MDPATVIGLISGCLSIATTTVNTIKSLSGLKEQYARIEQDMSLLSGRINTICAALYNIDKWARKSQAKDIIASPTGPCLESSIQSCMIVISGVEEHAQAVSSLKVRDKIRHLWNKDTLTELSQSLDCQINALQLLVSTINLSSPSQQRTQLESMVNRKILERARDAATIYVKRKVSTTDSSNLDTPSQPLPQSVSRLSLQSTIVDDLDDYKLEVSFERDSDCVLHTKFVSDRARGIRRVPVVQKWRPQKPPLGAGMFGSVRLEICSDSIEKPEQRAVKKLQKMHLDRLKIDFRKELIALTKFSRRKFSQCEIFVDFLGWFEDDDNVFLAMEYFPLGTLHDHINEEILEHDVKIISAQLLEGLTIMHKECFTHRDLKPQNIFVVQRLPEYWIKIGDFGISKRVSNDETYLHTATGTPHYLAPEISNAIELDDDSSDEEETQSYTNAVDVWSFACVIYQLLALKVPFPKRRDLVRFCRGGKFPEPALMTRTSDEGIAFVKSVLVPDPSLRPSAEVSLRSEWLKVESKARKQSLNSSQLLDVARALDPSESTLPDDSSSVNPNIDIQDEASTKLSNNQPKRIGPFKTARRISGVKVKAEPAFKSTPESGPLEGTFEAPNKNLGPTKSSPQKFDVNTPLYGQFKRSTSVADPDATIVPYQQATVAQELPGSASTNAVWESYVNLMTRPPLGTVVNAKALEDKTKPIPKSEPSSRQVLKNNKSSQEGFKPNHTEISKVAPLSRKELELKGVHMKCRNGMVDLVSEALKRGVDVDSLNASGNTLLISAMQCDSPSRINLVDLLMEKGADLEARDSAGHTALLLACSGRTPDWGLALMLLKSDVPEKRSDWSARNSDGMTALHLVARHSRDYYSIPFLRRLLEVGADINQIDTEKYRNRPIHHACMSGNSDVASVLINGGCINDSNSYGLTPLLLAASAGYDRIVTILVRSRRVFVDVDTEVDDRGATALHLAAESAPEERNHSATIPKLLDYGSNPNARDKHGETPIFYALRAGKQRHAKCLVEAGALINVISARGEKCVYVVNGNGTLEIVKTSGYVTSGVQLKQRKGDTYEKSEEERLGLVKGDSDVVGSSIRFWTCN